MCGKIEKSYGGTLGTLPGPRGGAEAGERREAPNGGRSGGPRARSRARGDFQIPEGQGDLRQNPQEIIRILYIFFCAYIYKRGDGDLFNCQVPFMLLICNTPTVSLLLISRH